MYNLGITLWITHALAEQCKLSTIYPQLIHKISTTNAQPYQQAKLMLNKGKIELSTELSIPNNNNNKKAFINHYL